MDVELPPFIFNVPGDCWRYISLFMTYSEICRLKRTCTRMRAALSGKPTWRSKIAFLESQGIEPRLVVVYSKDRQYQAYVRKQLEKKRGILADTELNKVLSSGKIISGRLWYALYNEYIKQSRYWYPTITVPIHFIGNDCAEMVNLVDVNDLPKLQPHSWEAALKYRARDFAEMAIRTDHVEKYLRAVDHITKHPPDYTIYYLSWTDLCKQKAVNIITYLILTGPHKYLFPRKDEYEELNQWPKIVASPVSLPFLNDRYKVNRRAKLDQVVGGKRYLQPERFLYTLVQ